MKRFSNDDVKEIANIIKNDGIISVPTDTVYGLCTRIKSEVAYNKLAQIKHRPSQKSFPIMCNNISQIKEIAVVNENAEKIIKHFMPGPITIILLKKSEVENTINNAGLRETNEVAFRLAPNQFLHDLIKEVGVPIFMTSANISNEPVCVSPDEIEEKLQGLDGIVEGDTFYNKSSTMVDCTSTTIKIQREGPISLEDILEVLKK